jgi:hypothetical protein
MRVASGPIEIAIAYTLKESLLLLLKSIPARVASIRL